MVYLGTRCSERGHCLKARRKSRQILVSEARLTDAVTNGHKPRVRCIETLARVNVGDLRS